MAEELLVLFGEPFMHYELLITIYKLIYGFIVENLIFGYENILVFLSISQIIQKWM
jgi:hypothetical protein